VRIWLALFGCLLLAACGTVSQDTGGLVVTKTFGLFGVVTTDSLAIGPGYAFTATLSDDCRALIVGETQLTLADVAALCDGETSEDF